MESKSSNVKDKQYRIPLIHDQGEGQGVGLKSTGLQEVSTTLISLACIHDKTIRQILRFQRHSEKRSVGASRKPYPAHHRTTSIRPNNRADLIQSESNGQHVKTLVAELSAVLLEQAEDPSAQVVFIVRVRVRQTHHQLRIVGERV